MNFVISLAFIFIFTGASYAGTVLIRKSDGYPIEYQSGDVPVSVMMQNNPSYSKVDVEVRDIDDQDWQSLRENKIDAPAREIMKRKEQQRIEKEDVLKDKLKLSGEDWEALKQICK